MSPLSSLSAIAATARDRVLRALLRRGAPPVDDTPADGGRGAHPLGAIDASGARCATADAAPLASLGDQALAAGRGEASGLTQALAWIAVDQPGQGPDWSDPAQVACRLIHLAAIWAWTVPDAAGAAALGGSARAHARWLQRERPLDDADPTVTLAHAACVIAGLSWPSLEDASAWVGDGLTNLRSSTQALVGTDGASAAEPAAAARALWAVALVRAWADCRHVAVPSGLTGAFLRGSACLWRLCGDTGALPAATLSPPSLLPLGPTPLALTLRGLVLAWKLDTGSPVSQHDAAVVCLAGSQHAGPPVPMAPDGQWTLWSWRSTGMAITHAQVKGHAGRGWFRQTDGRVQWDLDGQALVVGQRPSMLLTVARVDGAKARVITVQRGTDPRADDRSERELTWRQARLTVTDHGVSRVDWEVGPGWDLRPGDKDDWTSTKQDLTLLVKLDGDGWTWQVSGRTIVGEGPTESTVRSSFELR